MSEGTFWGALIIIGVICSTYSCEKAMDRKLECLKTRSAEECNKAGI